MTIPLEITRKNTDGCKDILVQESDRQEHHITFAPLKGENAQTFLERCGNSIKQLGSYPIRIMVLGPVAYASQCVDALNRLTTEHNCPITWIEGGTCGKEPLCGVYAQTISGIALKPVAPNGHPHGFYFDDGDSENLFLGNLHASNLSTKPEAQTEDTIQLVQKILAEHNFQFTDVARTWLFIDNILDWYDGFNAVRNRLYQDYGLFDTRLPASTGIGAASHTGAALTADIYAIRPKNDSVRIQTVQSPLQKPAPRYGSAFSRAMEISTPNIRRIIVSGTASIAEEGDSMYRNDPQAQILRTMDVIEAILNSRGLQLSDTTRAIAYVKDPLTKPFFDSYCQERGLDQLPFITTCCDVCRDDLLFEVEVDAIALLKK